jgi:ABC-type amino acid transport substrate-binding protein
MFSRRTLLAGLTALVLAPLSVTAADLPDLAGRTVIVVTENAYPPLQFVDPKTGKAIGWEYDAMDEIAKRLNFKLEYPEHQLGRDDPGGFRRPVRYRHDRHHHQGRAQGEGGFFRSLYALAAVHAGARR